jgi:NAD(P)-dependent dehydrogenase (short-subunit alcohol dehydrogenase family)
MGLLDGKTAVVTGSGRGIGRGIAIALAKEGAKVVVNDLGAALGGEGTDKSPAQQVVDEIAKAGGKAVANFGSVSDFGQATDMVEQAVREWGRIDILVNVAGILRDRMVFNMTEEEWDIVLAVHLKGTFNTIRAASVHMREAKAGRIVNMSSVSALGAPGQPNYAAGKAGILGLTWSTAHALGKYGVTSNAILPSGATRMIDSTPRGPSSSRPASGRASRPRAPSAIPTTWPPWWSFSPATPPRTSMARPSTPSAMGIPCSPSPRPSGAWRRTTASSPPSS